MFHTLSELKEKEKNNGKLIPNKSITSMPKERTPKDNYYGKGNKAYDYYNKKPSENVNTNFEKTKNKITLIVFKNGFIIDNGPFRDGSIPENQKFMEQVEKGYIPHELTDKGINDLGILLINRKSEVYYQQMGPVTHITQITQINPINPITINPNVNSYNQYTNYDNIFNNYTYNYILNTASKYNEQYEQLLNQVLYNSNNSLNNYNQYVYNPVIQTPMGNRSIRREIFVPKDNVDIPNTETRDYKRTERHTSSVPKKEPKNRFETFHNFKRQELIKEEEEKKRKNKINMNKEKKETKEEKKEEKKFTAFGGTGQAIGNINTEGLNVQTDLKNSINIFKPVCTINIRLFNGEIAKCEFNYTQTLRDVYFYVRKISGSNNFTLLDGFPPKPLRDYDRTIGQLKLENTTLTQRLNS